MKMRDTSIDFAISNNSIINNQSEIHQNNQSQVNFNNQLINKLGSEIFKDQSILQSQGSIIFNNQLAIKSLNQFDNNQNQQALVDAKEQNIQSRQIYQIDNNIFLDNNQVEDQSQNQIVLDISKTSDNKSQSVKVNQINENSQDKIQINQQKIEQNQKNTSNNKIYNLEEEEKINIDLSESVDNTVFRENITENIQEEYLALNNPDIIQVNNYQTQINQESDVKQDQINLTSPQAKSKRISKYENELDSNQNAKKSLLNSLPKSPLNKIGLNKEHFTTFNADISLITQQQKNIFLKNSSQNVNIKENQGDKIEVVGKIVGQQIKKTFNFIYDKIQEGVITTLNQAIENQKEHERLNNRRAYSLNPSLDQQRFILNNNNQQNNGMNEQINQHSNYSIHYPPALSPSLNSLSNINIKTARESRSVFRQQLAITGDFQDKNYQNDRNIQGRPPQHTARDRIENKLSIKSQQIIDKNLQNEIVNLRQEKIFLVQRIENQEQEFQDQLQIIQEKQKYKNDKYEQKQKYFNEFLDELQKQIKIDSVKLDDENIQQENLKYFEYEVLKHLFNQNEEIQKLKEQNLKYEGALEMKTEELRHKTQELFNFQEQQKQDNIQKQIDQTDFQNEREAQQLRIQLQNEKIQEMSKIVEESKEKLRIQDEFFRKQEQQTKNLNSLINEQNSEFNFKVKSLQEKIQQKQNEIDDFKELNYNLQIEFKEKENKFQKKLEILQKRIEELEQLKDMSQSHVKQQNEINLQKAKKSFKLECDLEQMQKQIDKLQKEMQVIKIQKEELQNQNQDNLQRLKITEFQLIQAKSSWAESEHEREQLFNRVQELEERLDPGNYSQRSFLMNLDNQSSKSKSNI